MNTIAKHIHTTVKNGRAEHSSTDIIDALCLLFPGHMHNMTQFIPERASHRVEKLDRALLLAYTEHGEGYKTVFVEFVLQYAMTESQSAARHYFHAPLDARHKDNHSAEWFITFLSNPQKSVIVLDVLVVPFKKHERVAAIFVDFFEPYLKRKKITMVMYLTEMLSKLSLRLRKDLFHPTFKRMAYDMASRETGMKNSSKIWLCPLDKRHELVFSKDGKALQSTSKNVTYDKELLRDNQP